MRLPNKLLLAESGQPVLSHTLKQCLKSGADRVIAAVDCPELASIAEKAGAVAILTDPALPSGSDRVWAAAQEFADAEFVINVQGDEPEIDPGAIDAVLTSLESGCDVTTLAAPLDPEFLHDSAAVKVVSRPDGRALYFSRAALVDARLHIGLYGYSRQALGQFAGHSPTPLELAERLEQLRFLEMGFDIQVLDWPHAFPGIDTRVDYDHFLQRIASAPSHPHD
jgi:3-deoxy-manno-octulosonate cytidylyltransferase (CMP-KDO synthetase)